MVQELKAVIGKDASCNYSPTSRGKLISVGPVHCVIEVYPSEYTREGKDQIGKRFTLRTWITYNMFFA